MTEEELSSLVYTLWPGTDGSQNDSIEWPVGIPSYPDWLNSTAVDDVFGFGERYDRRPPVFQKLPMPYNTVLNHTGEFPDSIYLLATGADTSYMMCSLRTSLSANCSTRYKASMSGGKLESRCEDPGDSNTYIRSKPDALSGFVQRDWASVATEWAISLSLNAGTNDANASIARLLTEFIPVSTSLSPFMPSIAEALAALAGSTLLLSAVDAPFDDDWKYTSPILPEPVQQGFNATVQTHEYRSSYAQNWQRGFFVVLFGTFVISCYSLHYLFRKGKFLTDFTEPPNLFALAMESSPSRSLEGACGAGPEKEQLRKKWSVKTDHSQHVHFESAIPGK